MTSIRDKLSKKTSKLAQARPKEEDHPAKLDNYEDGGFHRVDLEIVKPDPNQPRKFFDQQALEELAESIKQKGVLQPVIIRRDAEGQIFLIAGERRWRAAKMAGLTQIPAILKTKDNALEISMIENLQRENLNPVEEADALQKMIDQHGYSQKKLATVIGKARTTINEILGLNRLPEEIKEECRNASIYPIRLLIEIAKQDSPEAMIKLFQTVKEGNLNSSKVRNITRKKVGKVVMGEGEIAIKKVKSFVLYLENLKIEELKKEEKNRFFLDLKELKKIIQEVLG
jgi:ParB family chromosome partitioning protein